MKARSQTDTAGSAAGSGASVRICMGSSCFARGNNEVLSAITAFLEEAELADRVDLRGHLCADRCSHGPIVTIDGQVHEGLEAHAVIDLIRRACSRTETEERS
ncbi:MAG: (2Fe-2S) ferredoxin domain-containing protein [bacterium]